MSPFRTGRCGKPQRDRPCGQTGIPFGNNLLFRVQEQPLLTFFAEICEDLWVPVLPSSHGALAGANVLLNLSASNITIGKADYRRELVRSQSGRCLAGYIYAAAGNGELASGGLCPARAG